MSRKFSRDSCLRQPALGKIETALAEVCGGRVGLVLTTHDDPADAAEPSAPRPTFTQQQAEMAAQPFVKKAMELFDVDPSRMRVVSSERS
jgi:hypothetical protein